MVRTGWVLSLLGLILLMVALGGPSEGAESSDQTLNYCHWDYNTSVG